MNVMETGALVSIAKQLERIANALEESNNIVKGLK